MENRSVTAWGGLQGQQEKDTDLCGLHLDGTSGCINRHEGYHDTELHPHHTNAHILTVTLY